MFGNVRQIVEGLAQGEKLPDAVSETEKLFRASFTEKYKEEFLAFADVMQQTDSDDERDKYAEAAAGVLAYLVAELMKKAEINAWATTAAQNQVKDMRQEGFKPN